MSTERITPPRIHEFAGLYDQSHLVLDFTQKQFSHFLHETSIHRTTPVILLVSMAIQLLIRSKNFGNESY